MKPKPKSPKPQGNVARTALLLTGLCSLALVGFVWMFGRPPSRTRGSSTINQSTLERFSADELEKLLKLPQRSQVAADASFEVDAWTQRIDKALQSLNEQFPSDAEAAHLTGLIQSRLKRTQLAEPALKRAVELAPGNAEMRLDLAELLAQLGREEDALVWLREVTTTSASPEFLSKLGDCQVRLGQLDLAAETFAKALESSPKTITLWIKQGEVQLQQQAYEACEASVRKALELDANNIQAWTLLGRVLTLLKRTDQAKEAIARTAELKKASLGQPSDMTLDESTAKVYGAAFRSLAILLQTKANTDQANSMFALGLQADPEDWLALGKWAALLRKLGELEQAATFERRLIVAQPEEIAHYQNLANLSMELGRPREAEAALRLACLKLPGNGQCRLMLARFLVFLNKPNEAVKFAQAAHELLNSEESAQLLNTLH